MASNKPFQTTACLGNNSIHDLTNIKYERYSTKEQQQHYVDVLPHGCTGQKQGAKRSTQKILPKVSDKTRTNKRVCSETLLVSEGYFSRNDPSPVKTKKKFSHLADREKIKPRHRVSRCIDLERGSLATVSHAEDIRNLSNNNQQVGATGPVIPRKLFYKHLPKTNVSSSYDLRLLGKCLKGKSTLTLKYKAKLTHVANNLVLVSKNLLTQEEFEDFCDLLYYKVDPAAVYILSLHPDYVLPEKYILYNNDRSLYILSHMVDKDIWNNWEFSRYSIPTCGNYTGFLNLKGLYNMVSALAHMNYKYPGVHYQCGLRSTIASKLIAKFVEVEDVVAGLLDKVRETITQIIGDQGEAIIVALIYFYSAYKTNGISLALAFAFRDDVVDSVIKLGKTLGSYLLQAVKHLKPVQMFYQSNDSDDNEETLIPIVKSIKEVFCSIIGLPTKVTNLLPERAILKDFSLLTSSLNNFSRLFDWLVSFSLRLLYLLMDVYQSITRAVSESPVSEAKKVLNKYTSTSKLTISESKIIVSQYETLRSEWLKYNPIQGNDRGNHIYNMYINTLLTKFENIYSKAQTVLASSLKRDTPLSIYLEGEPSTGKSHILRKLLDIAYLAKFKSLPGGEDIFHVPRDEAYFDGYQNQEITIFDDADVSSCKKARALMVGIKLNMINTAICPLPAADPAKKNNLLFTSSFVGTTTNLRAHPTNTAIVDFQALERRYHVQVKIAADPDNRSKNIYTLLNSDGTPYKQVSYEWLQMYVFFLSTNWSILSGDNDFSPSGSAVNYKISNEQDPYYFTTDYFATLRKKYHVDNITFLVPLMHDRPEDSSLIPIDMQTAVDRLASGKYTVDIDSIVQDYKKLSAYLNTKGEDYNAPTFAKMTYQGAAFTKDRAFMTDICFRLSLLNDKLGSFEEFKLRTCYYWWSASFFVWEKYKDFVSFVRKYDTEIWTGMTLLASLALIKWNHKFVLEQMKRAEELNHTLNPVTLQLTPNPPTPIADPQLQESGEASGQSLVKIKTGSSKGRSIKDIVSLQNVEVPDRKIYIKTPHSIYTGFLLDSTTILLTRHEALAIDKIEYMHYKEDKIILSSSFQLKIVDDLQSGLLVLSIKDQIPSVRSIISNLYATEQSLTSDLLRYDVYSAKHRQLTPYYIAQGLSLTNEEYLSLHVPLPGVKGDCGSPFYIITADRPKFIGIHYAGTTSTSICDIFTRVHLDALLVSEGHIPIHSELTEYRVQTHGITTHDIIHQQRKSSLIPSVLHGFHLEPDRTPAILNKRAMNKALSKLNEKVYPVDEQLLSISTLAVTQLLSDYSYKTVELDQAVSGYIGDVKCLDPIKKETSAGLNMGKKSEYIIFDEATERNIPTLAFTKTYTDYVDSLPQLPYQDALKDELRPLSKIETCDTRLFSIGDIHLICLSRCVFMDLTRSIMDRASYGPISLGINAHSKQWGDLYTSSVDRVGKNYRIYTGDKSRYDQVVPTAFNLKVSEILKSFYPEEAHIHLDYLIESCTYSHHVFHDVEYKKVGGNCSGGPSTTIINSITNLLLTYYVFHDVLQSKGLTLESNDKLVVHVFGDDDIIFVSESLHKKVTMVDMKDSFAKLGITYTAAIKENEVLPYTPIDQVRYLQRAFIKRNNYIYAPRDLDRMYHQLAYISKSYKYSPEIYNSMLQSILIDMLHHTFDEYKVFRRRLIEFSRSICSKKSYLINERVINTVLSDLNWITYHDLMTTGQTQSAEKTELWEQFIQSNQIEYQSKPLDSGAPSALASSDTVLTMQLSTPQVPENSELTSSIEQDKSVIDSIAPISKITETSLTTVSTDLSNLNPYTRVEHNDLILRPILMATYEWKPTSTTQHFPLPGALDINGSNPLADAIKRFYGFRARLRLTFEFNASPLFGGTLIASFLPAYQQPDNDNLLSLHNALVSPNVFIRMSEPDGIVFEPPIVYPFDYIRCQPDVPSHGLGTLVIQPLNPMVVPADATNATVHVNITAQLMDVDLLHPTLRYQSEQELKSSGSLVHKVIGRVIEAGTPLLRKPLETLKASNPIVKSVAGLFGLSNPTNISATSKQELIATSGVNHVSGLVNAQTIALGSGPTMITDPSVFGVDLDNGNLNNILGYEGLISQFTWTDLAPVYDLKLTPHMFKHAKYKDYGTPGYYLGNYIQFFRGSMTYRLHYTMNKMTKVKIAFIYSAIGIDLDIGRKFRDVYINETHTLTGDGYLDFVVPYVNTRRYQQVSVPLGEVGIMLLAPPYNSNDIANSSVAKFSLTVRFNNDLELYGTKNSDAMFQSSVGVAPPQTCSLQRITHVKELMMAGQAALVSNVHVGTHSYVISTAPLFQETFFALQRSAYRYFIYGRGLNYPMFISGDVYAGVDDSLYRSFKSFVPYTPDSSQNGVVVELPRYATTNFTVNRWAVGPAITCEIPTYDLSIKRDAQLEGQYIFIAKAVSDEASYTWFQIPKSAGISTVPLHMPTLVHLQASE